MYCGMPPTQRNTRAKTGFASGFTPSSFTNELARDLDELVVAALDDLLVARSADETRAAARGPRARGPATSTT